MRRVASAARRFKSKSDCYYCCCCVVCHNLSHLATWNHCYHIWSTSLLQNYYVLWKMPCFPYFPPLFIWITVPNPKCSVCVTNQPHSLYFLQAICVLFNEFHRYFAKFHWSSILQPQWYAPLMSSKSFDWIWQMMRIYFSTFCDIFYFDCVCFDAKTLACIKLRLESSAWNAPNHIEIYIEFNPKNNKRGSI